MAKREVVVGFHVQGTEGFQQKTAAANKAIKNVSAEIRKLDATYGKGSKNSDYLAQRTELLTQKLEAQKQKTEALRQGLEQYRNSEKASAAEIERRENQLKNCEIAEADLTRQIRECSTAMKNQQSGIDESVKGLQEFEKKAQSVGNSLTRALTVPIAGMGTLALKNVLEFEDAMKTVQTLPGVTTGTIEEQAEQLEAYSEAILEASNNTHVAAEELAAAQYSAISSGVAAEESVYMVERSAKAAKAGLSDVETVVDGATSALNAWKDTAGGLDHVLDAMMVAQNVGKTTIDELASNIGQVTGLAPQLGVSLDEVLASVAALTQGGVATSTAFNGLKAVMSNVLKPTAEAREEAERLGFEFSAAAMQAKGFTGFLESVMEATQGDAESLGKLFGSTEALSEIMALGTTQAGNYADALNQIGGAAGAVDEAFEIRTSSKLEKLNGSLNKLRNAGMDLAEAMYPAVETLADLAGKAAEIVGNMDEGTQQTLVYVLGITAAVGPAVKMVGSLAGTTANLISAGSKIKTLLTGTGGLVKAVGGTGGLAAGAKALLSTLAGPVGLVAVVGTGLAAAGYAASQAVSKLGRDYTQLEETIKNIDLEPDQVTLSNMTEQINAAIAEANSTKTVTVTASVQADFSDMEAEYDSIAQALDAAVQAAMGDYRLSWKEYEAITQTLNSEFLPDARSALSDPTKAATASALIGMIDDANALLRTLYTSGDSVTAEEVAQLDTLLSQIYEYRAEVSGIAAGTATQYKTLTTMINSAASDYRISESEYEEIRRHLEEDVAPEAEKAMQDAATKGVGENLNAALTELDAILAAVYQNGGSVTEAELVRINELLAEIQQCRTEINAISGEAGGVYAELIRTVRTASEDYRISKQEYEAVKKQLDENVAPQVEEAMEDAATNGVANELDKALAELDTLMQTIADAGRDATQDEIDEMNALLSQIADLQHQIAVIQGNAELLDTWGDELKMSDEFFTTASGYATPDIAAKAAGNAIALRQQSRDALAGEESRLEAEYAAKIAEAKKSNDTDAMDDAKAAYEDQMAMIAREREAVEAEFFQNLQQLWLGYAESTDEGADILISLDKIGKYVDNILRSETMSSEQWAGILAEDEEIRDKGWDYDYIKYVLDDGKDTLDSFVLSGAAIRWKQAQIDGLTKEITKIDLGSTDLDEYYLSMLPEDFDVNAQDAAGLNETFANYQRYLLIMQQGPEALYNAMMSGLTQGSEWSDYDWEDYDWGDLGELDEAGAEAAGKAYGEAIKAGLQSSVAGAEAAAGEMANDVEDAAELDTSSAEENGRSLAAALGAGISAGAPATIAQALALASQVNSVLSGMSPVLPGSGLGDGGGTAAVVAKDFGGGGKVDQSIHVGIQNANFTNEAGIRATAAKLNTYSRMKNAGVGNVTRG